jgi:hypothetical protein
VLIALTAIREALRPIVVGQRRGTVFFTLAASIRPPEKKPRFSKASTAFLPACNKAAAAFKKRASMSARSFI